MDTGIHELIQEIVIHIDLTTHNINLYIPIILQSVMYM